MVLSPQIDFCGLSIWYSGNLYGFGSPWLDALSCFIPIFFCLHFWTNFLKFVFLQFLVDYFSYKNRNIYGLLVFAWYTQSPWLWRRSKFIKHEYIFKISKYHGKANTVLLHDTYAIFCKTVFYVIYKKVARPLRQQSVDSIELFIKRIKKRETTCQQKTCHLIFLAK